jgi:hypothetical protein
VMACGSLALTFFIPRHPEEGAETIFVKPPLAAQ